MEQGKEFSSAPEVMNQTFLEIVQKKDRKPHCTDTQEKSLTKRHWGAPNNIEGKMSLSHEHTVHWGLLLGTGSEMTCEWQYL